MRAPRLFAFLLALVALLVPLGARAYDPPPLRGHVVDTAGALTRDEASRLDAKLDRARRQTGFHVVVLVLASLPQGESIEDVGYEAGNKWGVGSKKGDDGVLLIASLAEHKLRIETGRGVGGALTDVESHHINRDVIGPLMKEGHVYDAMDRGTDAILDALVKSTPGGVSKPGMDPRATREARQPPDPVKLIAGGIALVLIVILLIVSPTFRRIFFWVLIFGGRGGGGGGGGGSGYGGGGGSFGGGGSSDDY